MKNGNARRLSVVVIAILTAALALSASAGAQPAGPKADHIAFMSMKDGQADIYTMDAAGFAQVNLTHDQTIGWRTDSEPAWSPNGEWVAFQRAYTKAQELGTRLFVVSSYGKEMHALTPTTDLAVIDQHPAWSPDGSRIVFSSNRAGHFELYMVKATGTGLVRLTYTNVGTENLEPNWSPDGQSIAFVRRQWSGSPEIPSIPTDSIYTLSFTNSVVHRMTSPPIGRSDGQPAWSADSRRIAFESNRTGNWDIYIVNRTLATTSLMRVTSSKYAELHPTWAPYGNEIALISDRTGATELYTLVLPVPGSITPPQQPRQLTFDKAPKSNPSWEHVFMSTSS
jgi:TolB protein